MLKTSDGGQEPAFALRSREEVNRQGGPKPRWEERGEDGANRSVLRDRGAEKGWCEEETEGGVIPILSEKGGKMKGEKPPISGRERERYGEENCQLF